MNEKKVLIGSPVRQNPEILKQFLLSLKELEKENILLEYFFIDDNDNLNSKELLKLFSKEVNEKSTIETGETIDEYIRTDNTHIWKENLIWKVAEYKNKIIDYCKKKEFDYLFLIDSDLVLHPKTLKHLISTEKDIISEIFWTKWSKETIELPQVWLYNQYDLIAKNRGEQLNENEEKWRFSNLLQQLRKPGVYEVGGLGACTLISKTAIDKGVNFSELYNISFWGEDRHFCIRAVALGFKLYVDTTYPAYHIYHMEHLNGVEEFKNKCRGNEAKLRIAKEKGNTLTLAMLVRNESKKFIREVLSHAAKYIDNAVILDDASDDNTVQICKEVLKDIPLKLVSNKESRFNNEIVLRKQLWQMAIETNPDWILILDSDEMFEDKIINAMPLLINQSSFDIYYFRLYDMWDEYHYREDDYWQAHNFNKPFLVRYQPNFEYIWNETPLHCGRFPINIFSLSGCNCSIRLKHLGWSTKQIREEKFKRYLKLDPKGTYGNMKQYISILDENPRLIEWKD
ncbi:Glycosyltransferase, GT2 family [Clostridium cavendishii DSM 21758]|uniref:Glycosyltransferase, GT2 family n=1 Tax=Clostridium cavendishii DSM 21758 TaxID=1121302 RepID=A0A1M6JIK6_9CLOT|nr:glycosyltransferase [Clostridium cavendishii]SHJ46475.1 Glycosyltransferase, GT2 family [Clostridium cavendishii DSM 21758]